MTKSDRKHLFGLDLVRCIAVLLVLINHCGLAFTAWSLVERPAYLDMFGYYGVELFFVLSGFLIGGILLDTIASRPAAHEWFVFMARRWMRTLPLYFVWLAVISSVWPPGPAHNDWGGAWHLVLQYVWFGQNLAWPADDWFAVAWSLSIEEWFYLTFSLVLLISARLLGARHAVLLTLSSFLIIPVLLRLAQSPQENWNEYLHKAVIFRLDAIACGVLIVTICRAKQISTVATTVLFGLGAFIIALQCSNILAVEDIIGIRYSRALGFDATDFGLAIMLPAAARLPSPSTWLYAPIRLFAAQSYGTYLMHYTLIEWVGFARIYTHWSGQSASLLTIALILVLPALSWHLFEKPMLKFRPVPRRAAEGSHVIHTAS